MALEVVKRLQAIIALVGRFAWCGAKSADEFGVFRIAPGTMYRPFFKIHRLVTGLRRSNPERLQPLLALFADPVCGPGW